YSDQIHNYSKDLCKGMGPSQGYGWKCCGCGKGSGSSSGGCVNCANSGSTGVLNYNGRGDQQSLRNPQGVYSIGNTTGSILSDEGALPGDGGIGGDIIKKILTKIGGPLAEWANISIELACCLAELGIIVDDHTTTNDFLIKVLCLRAIREGLIDDPSEDYDSADCNNKDTALWIIGDAFGKNLANEAMANLIADPEFKEALWECGKSSVWAGTSAEDDVGVHEI